MRKFSAIHIRDGGIRRVTIEAKDDGEAADIARAWGIGIEGEAHNDLVAQEPEREAYPLDIAGRLLGGLSRSTLYRELAAGRLERKPGIRRVLITARSIKAWRRPVNA